MLCTPSRNLKLVAAVVIETATIFSKILKKKILPYDWNLGHRLKFLKIRCNLKSLMESLCECFFSLAVTQAVTHTVMIIRTATPPRRHLQLVRNAPTHFWWHTTTPCSSPTPTYPPTLCYKPKTPQIMRAVMHPRQRKPRLHEPLPPLIVMYCISFHFSF